MESNPQSFLQLEMKLPSLTPVYQPSQTTADTMAEQVFGFGFLE